MQDLLNDGVSVSHGFSDKNGYTSEGRMSGGDLLSYDYNSKNSNFHAMAEGGLKNALSEIKGSVPAIEFLEPISKQETLTLDKQTIRNSNGEDIINPRTGIPVSKLDYVRMMLQKNGHESIGDRFLGAYMSMKANVKNAPNRPGSQPSAFQQALTYVEPNLFLSIFAPIMFHSAFEIYNKGGFQDSVQFQAYNSNQPFQAVADSDNSLNPLNVSAIQTEIELHTYAATLEFNFVQIQQYMSQLNNMTNDTHVFEFYKALRALFIYLGYTMFLRIDRAIWQGDSRTGAYGVLNHPSIPKITTAFNWGSTQTNPSVILENLRTIITRVRANSNSAFTANTLLLSSNLMANALSYRAASSTYYLRSILGWFTQCYNMGIRKILVVPGLDGQGTGGNEVCIAYDQNSEVQMSIIPQLGFPIIPNWTFQQLNLPYGFRFGGFLNLYPNSMVIANNITD